MPKAQTQAQITVDEFVIRPLTEAEMQAVMAATAPENGPDELDQYLASLGL